MRETVRSLRLYLILAGVGVVYAAGKQLREPAVDTMSRVLTVLILLVGLGQLVSGLNLRAWLRTRPALLAQIVWTQMLLQWAAALYFGLIHPVAAVGIALIVIRPLFVALLGFYLLWNIRRLAAQSVAPGA